MDVQTTVKLSSKNPFQLDYDSKVLLFGSCFAENIGSKLAYYNFQQLCNPFGILFHPEAIERQITAAINQKEYREEELFLLNEQWHSFDAHSKLSAHESADLISSLNKAVEQTNHYLKEASHLFISLGTAWVYRHIETDTVVANCHKIAQKNFLKELLSVEAIVQNLEASIRLARSINPTMSIILTVSPVRHLKDGMIENNRSKAHLLAALHQLVDPRNNVHYFPSYELLLDELRDYRYYDRDMVHPSDVAIDYIWEKFQRVWVHPATETTMKEVDSIRKGLAHKPFNPKSQDYQRFTQELQKKMETLQARFPFMSFGQDR